MLYVGYASIEKLKAGENFAISDVTLKQWDRLSPSVSALGGRPPALPRPGTLLPAPEPCLSSMALFCMSVCLLLSLRLSVPTTSE